MSTHEAGEDAEAVVRTVPAETDSAQPAPEQSEDSQIAAKVGELENRWHRAVADLDNLRKRYSREMDREQAAARARVAAAWLPVVDNLELALAHAGDGSDPLVEGVRAVRDQAVEILARLGFPRHDEIGVPFDPMMHEVVAAVENRPDIEPGTVVQVVRPGYGEGENQLRPAAVIVSRRPGD